MFFRSKKPPTGESSELEDVINQSLPDADPDTRSIVAAVAGLLGCISYADRNFTGKEQAIVRNLLQTIHGISATESDAILTAIEKELIVLTTTSMRVTHARSKSSAIVRCGYMCSTCCSTWPP